MPQEKTSIVKRIGENFREFKGAYGVNYVHLISFANGDSGEYYSMSKSCTKFKEGEEATYSVEEKEYNGETILKIKPVLVEKKKMDFGKGTYQRFDANSELCTCARSSAMSTCELIRDGIIHLDEFESTADRIFEWQKKNAKL